MQRILILLLTLFLLNGCASTIVGMMKRQPAFNWTYLPKTLKKGNTATYESFDGTQSWQLEVTDVKEDVYFMKMYWLTAPEEVSFLKDVSYEFEVRKNGYTKSAYLVERSGERTKLPIAKPGDFGYLQNPKPVKLKKPEWVDTPVGKFKVEEVVVYTSKSSSPIGGFMDLTCVSFVSNTVPFGYVMQKNTASIELPLSNLMEFIDMVSPLNKTYKSLMSYLISFEEMKTVSDGNHLVKFN